MNLSEETRTVERILSGKETRRSAELRVAGENIVLAKSFVKAAFFDIQQEMFTDPQYSRHMVERMTKQTKKFEQALFAYQSAEDKLTILFSRIDPPLPGMDVKPGDLTPNSQVGASALRPQNLTKVHQAETELLKELELTEDDTGI